VDYEKFGSAIEVKLIKNKVIVQFLFAFKLKNYHLLIYIILRKILC